MAIYNTIVNTRFPGLSIVPVGNMVAVVGTASQGPLTPTRVTMDTYASVFGNVPVDPTLLADTTLTAAELDEIQARFDRSIVKTLAELYEYGDSSIPVVALRVGNPTYSSRTISESASYTAELSEPSAAPTAVASDSGGTLDDGTYDYAVTFYNSIGETLVSDVVTVTVTGATVDTGLATLTIPVGAAGTTGRKIYRADSEGGTLYYLGTVSNNTATSYVDDGSAELSTTAVPSLNTTATPGYLMPTIVSGSGSSSLAITALEAGDEYNYFYVKVSSDGRTLSVRYVTPTVSGGSVNVIEDSDITTPLNIDMNAMTLAEVAATINSSVFGSYLLAEVQYIDATKEWAYDSETTTYSMDIGSPSSYNLKTIESIIVSGTVTEDIEEESETVTLSKVPYKSLSDDEHTITSATVTHVMELATTDFTLVEGVGYGLVLDFDSNKEDDTTTVVSFVDSLGVAVTTSTISGSDLLISEAEYATLTGPLTLTVTYTVILTEAKRASDLYSGIWSSYFVAGPIVYFGAALPYDIEIEYTAKVTLSTGSDYVLLSSGTARTRTGVISVRVITDSTNLTGIESGTMEMVYNYTPQKPGAYGSTTTYGVALTGGTDGSEFTAYEYKAAVEDAIYKLTNIAPTDLIVAGFYVDDSVYGYSSSDGMPAYMSVHPEEAIDPWLVTQSRTIKECRVYLPTKPLARSAGPIFDGSHAYIAKHYESDGTNYCPYDMRSGADNHLYRFVFGDILGSTSKSGGVTYPLNPAVISLVSTRLRDISQSKLHKRLSGVTSRIRIMDAATIEKVNAAGWEFYSGVTESDQNVYVQAVTERTGAAVGTYLDSQYVSDTALLACWFTRQALRPYEGMPANVQNINTAKQKACRLVADNVMPEPLQSYTLDMLPRTTNDIINEQMRIRLYITTANLVRSFSMETIVGISGL